MVGGLGEVVWEGVVLQQRGGWGRRVQARSVSSSWRLGDAPQIPHPSFRRSVKVDIVIDCTWLNSDHAADRTDEVENSQAAAVQIHMPVRLLSSPFHLRPPANNSPNNSPSRHSTSQTSQNPTAPIPRLIAPSPPSSSCAITATSSDVSG